MKNRVRGLLMFVIVVALAVAVLVVGRKAQFVDKMNAKELHYDADGWFIMVDKEHDLVGIYWATEPVRHIQLDTSRFENGVIDIPTWIYGGTMKEADEIGGMYNNDEKSNWWFEGHTKKGE